MTRLGWLNAAAAVAALGLGLALAQAAGGRAEAVTPSRHAPAASPEVVVDATGARVPVRRYDRIVSGSPLANRLLIDLVSPARIAAFAGTGADAGPEAYRYGGKPRLRHATDIESILGFAPDLFIVNGAVDGRVVDRLRALGVTTIDLGVPGDLDQLARIIERFSTVVGERARGERYTATLRERLERIAGCVPEQQRPTAIYVRAVGTTYYGGAAGTSPHSVLHYAGFVDAAASRYHGWPAYGVEALLSLDPAHIVTTTGGRDAICRAPAFERLRACAEPDGVLEVPARLMADGGPSMLEAAEYLHDLAFHGERCGEPGSVFK
ncbi:MAG: ABC transporter substrate-binding protein [Myxococcales bacterium]|nr:ABC transporter substrate-binding protein [Myxococcales bacterium]